MTADDFTELPPGPNGGLMCPNDVIVLAIDLERRGIRLHRQGDKLKASGVDGSKPTLTPEDIEAIRRRKDHLLAVVDYIPPKRTF